MARQRLQPVALGTRSVQRRPAASDRRTNRRPPARRALPTSTSVPGSGVGAVPWREKLALNFGAVRPPPTMSVPARSQFGSRLPLRIQAWRSPVKSAGPAADSQRNVTVGQLDLRYEEVVIGRQVERSRERQGDQCFLTPHRAFTVCRLKGHRVDAVDNGVRDGEVRVHDGSRIAQAAIARFTAVERDVRRRVHACRHGSARRYCRVFREHAVDLGSHGRDVGC